MGKGKEESLIFDFKAFNNYINMRIYLIINIF